MDARPGNANLPIGAPKDAIRENGVLSEGHRPPIMRSPFPAAKHEQGRNQSGALITPSSRPAGIWSSAVASCASTDHARPHRGARSAWNTADCRLRTRLPQSQACSHRSQVVDACPGNANLPIGAPKDAVRQNGVPSEAHGPPIMRSAFPAANHAQGRNQSGALITPSSRQLGVVERSLAGVSTELSG
jgi:hypothetical protein